MADKFEPRADISSAWVANPPLDKELFNDTTRGATGLGKETPTDGPLPGGELMLREDLRNGPQETHTELTTQTDINDVKIYDTTRDSDGGAWRKSCQRTSWYTEQLSTSQRGARAEFPSRVGIVCESNQVTLWDYDQARPQMWMVFDAANSNSNYGRALPGVESAFALSGMLFLQFPGSGGITVVDFIGDRARFFGSTGQNHYAAPVSGRNDAPGFNLARSQDALVSNSVNAVFAFIRPGTPRNPARFGLPDPTIVVDTDGGRSFIHPWPTLDTPRVVDETGFSNAPAAIGGVIGSRLFGISGFSSGAELIPIPYADGTVLGTSAANQIATGFSGSTISALASSRRLAAIGTDFGLSLSYKSEDGVRLLNSGSRDLIAAINSSYNTGWLPGYCRMAISETDASNITGSDKVTNGGFATDTDWIKGTGWTIGSGVASCDGTQSAASNLYQTPATFVAGQAYICQFTLSNRSAGQVKMILSATDVIANKSADGTYYGYFIASATAHSVFIQADANFVGDIDDVSVALALADRSPKQMGLQVVGTVNRAAVASNAELVAYSNFSSVNYLKGAPGQYDFGAGAFAFVAWYKASSNDERIIMFGDGGATDTRITLYTSTNSFARFFVDDGSSATDLAEGSISIVDSQWHMLVGLYRPSQSRLEIWVDGRLAGVDASLTSAGNSLTLAAGYLTVGLDADLTNFPADTGSIALPRISVGYAPTPEQIRTMYETERWMFQPGAKVTLQALTAGDVGVDAVNALAADRHTGRLAVAQDGADGKTGITVFNGLVVDESIIPTAITGEPTTYRDADLDEGTDWTNSNVDTLAFNDGALIAANAAAGGGVLALQPAINLREFITASVPLRPYDPDDLGMQENFTADATPKVIAWLPAFEGTGVERHIYYVTARERDDDSAAAEVASYTIEVLIKRDPNGNVTLIDNLQTVIHETTGTMDCAASADTTNQVVLITATGVASTDLKWFVEGKRVAA